MIEKTLSVTEAARLLGVSVPTVKRMAADGEIETFRTPGGHLRVTGESVQQLREGTTKETRHREPSPVLKNRRERVEELSLETQELRAQRDVSKLRKESAEEAERDRQEVLRRERELRHMEERNRLEQERRERKQQEEELAQREAEQRCMWKDGCLSEALDSLSGDCPKEYYADVCREVEEALDRLDPSRAEYVIRESVASAVERGLRSWRRAIAIEDANENAEKCLPLWARSYFGEPTQWQIKVRRMARENIARLPVDASLEEIRAAAIEAGQAVTRQYGQAEEMERRQRHKEAEQQKQQWEIQRGLAHVSSYLRQFEEADEFEFEDREWFTRKQEKRIRPELLKEVEADPDLDYRDVEEIVEDLVDEFLPEILEED